jgi:hypothetical protein
MTGPRAGPTQASQQSIASRRSRPRRAPIVEDELDLYLAEPKTDAEAYNKDPVAWWRDVGTYWFPEAGVYSL